MIYRGPEAHPKSGNTELFFLFRKVRTDFFLLPRVMSQEPNRNCLRKLAQLNFFILGGFYRVDFPPLSKRSLGSEAKSLLRDAHCWVPGRVCKLTAKDHRLETLLTSPSLFLW